MAHPRSPADSPLSSTTDDDGDGPHRMLVRDDPPPPKKRMKLAQASASAPAPAPPASVSAAGAPDADVDAAMAGADDDHHDDNMLDEDISEDTDGDVPGSPIGAGASSSLLTIAVATRPEDDDFQEQVTVCSWEGCHAGDLGNMDKLVEHVHNDHIEGRQKKYTCEWVGCSRKSMPHASGYALKAHVRSHTREKPFYCYLPECDRAFTRSDALAKHMRTVHETEALRPSDPVPKSMQSAVAAAAAAATGSGTGKGGKLKIVIKTPQPHYSTGFYEAADEINGTGDDAALASSSDAFTQLTEEQGFTDKELAMPLKRLVKLCRCQVQWAEAEAEELRKECDALEALYKQEWLEKEVLLDQVVQSEQDYHMRREAVLAGAADVAVANGGSGEPSAASPARKPSARLAASKAAATRPASSKLAAKRTASADGGVPAAGHAAIRDEMEHAIDSVET